MLGWWQTLDAPGSTLTLSSLPSPAIPSRNLGAPGLPCPAASSASLSAPPIRCGLHSLLLKTQIFFAFFGYFFDVGLGV